MENTFVYDIVVLKRVLNFTIKNLKKDHHLSDDCTVWSKSKEKDQVC